MASWREVADKNKNPRRKQVFSFLKTWLRNPAKHGLGEEEQQQKALQWVSEHMIDEQGLVRMLTILGEQAGLGPGFRNAAIGYTGHPNLGVRKAALACAEKPQEGQAAKALDDPAPEVRLEALNALLRMDARNRLKEVSGALKDADPRIRLAALQGLELWEARQHTDDIAGLLDDPQASVRARVLGLLSAWDVRTHAQAMAGLLKDRARVPDTTGPGENTVREEAVNALARIKARQWAPRLGRILKEKRTAIKPRAMEALGLMGAADQATAIAEFLEDQDPELRMAACHALWRLGAREYSQEVAKLLDDPYSVARALAIEALARFDAKEYAPSIRALAHDMEPGTLQCADLPDPEPPDALITYEVPLVRDHARNALKKWGMKV